MTEETKTEEKIHQKEPVAQEPGMTDSIGSFPVWLLKIIDAFTPGFLISEPPKKKEKPEN